MYGERDPEYHGPFTQVAFDVSDVPEKEQGKA